MLNLFKKKNLGVLSVVSIGVIIICIISIVLIKSNQTVRVWVPSVKLETGDIITDKNIMPIDIPASTPGPYIRNKDMIIGYKLKNSVSVEQLLYPSDFLASWESYSEDQNIPEDYVITSIQIPDNRAVGGLIVAGDTIDVMGVSTSGRKVGFEENTEINGRQNIGTNVYYILSNVKVINTNSSLSKAQNNDLSEVVGDSRQDGNFYIVALSYDDAKKLRQAEGVLELWLNIAPKQNEEHPPLINQMVGQSFSGLHDAQIPVMDKEGRILKGSSMVDEEGRKLEESDKTAEEVLNGSKTTEEVVDPGTDPVVDPVVEEGTEETSSE